MVRLRAGFTGSRRDMSSEGLATHAPRRRRPGGWLLLAVLGWTTVLQAGCYSVRPVAGTELQPGTRVVATLTPEGAEQVAAQVGPRVVGFEAAVGSAAGEQWEMFVYTLVKRDSTEETWNGERVMVPRAALASVSEKRLDRTRSYLAAGIITVGALLLARGFQTGFFSGGGDGPPEPPN